MANGNPAVYTNCYVELDIPDVAQTGEMAKLLVNSFTPPTWSTEAPKHKYFGDQGKTEVLHGGARNESWTPAQLGRAVDPDHAVFDWVQKIRQEGPTAAKKDITIKVQEPGGAGICVWSATGAVITHFSHGASNAATNEILVESITIDAETWDMKDGDGNDIAGGPDGGGGAGSGT